MTLLEPNPARARPGLSDRGRASWAGTVWLESGSTSTMSDLIRSDPTSTTSDLTRSMKSDPIRLEQMLIISDQNGSDLIATMSDSIGSNTDTDDVRSYLIGSDIANIGSDPMLTPMMSDSIRSDPTLMMPTRIPCVWASTCQLKVGTVASSTDSLMRGRRRAGRPSSVEAFRRAARSYSFDLARAPCRDAGRSPRRAIAAADAFEGAFGRGRLPAAVPRGNSGGSGRRRRRRPPVGRRPPSPRPGLRPSWGGEAALPAGAAPHVDVLMPHDIRSNRQCQIGPGPI